MIPIYLTFSINQTKAEDSVMLNRGNTAPFTGFLLSKEKVESFRKMSIENDSNKLTIESLNRTVAIYRSNQAFSDEQNQIIMNRLNETSEQLGKARSTSRLETTGYFLGGVLVTIGTAWALGKLKK